MGTVRVSIAQGIASLSDPDGYLLTVDDDPWVIPAAGDTILFPQRHAGERFTATLSGLAHGCWVASATRTTTVVADTTVDLRFIVHCSQQFGTVRVIARTVGMNFPGDGFRFVRDSQVSSIGANDTLALFGTPGSATSLQVVSDAYGCWSQDTSVHAVTFPAAGQLQELVFQQDCGVILFHAFPPTGPAQFFQVNVVTGQIRPLATMHTNAQGFRQSPDGRTIAFMAFNMTPGGNVELYSMTPSATDIQTIMTTPHNENWPSWSPDGASLFYADYEDGNIRRLDLHTRTVTAFTREADEETWPTMRPQGDRLAYDRYIGQVPQVWTMDTLGGDRRPAFPVAWTLNTPDWSPDGTRLVVAGTSDPNADRIKIFVGPLDAPPVPITSPGPQVSEGYPRWSPDGTRIAFIRILSDGSVRHLMIVRPDGTDLYEVPLPYAWNGDYNWIR